MDIKELRSQRPEALTKMLAEAERRLQELRFMLSSNQLSDVREVRETRKRIAQIKTLMTERMNSEEQPSA